MAAPPRMIQGERVDAVLGAEFSSDFAYSLRGRTVISRLEQLPALVLEQLILYLNISDTKAYKALATQHEVTCVLKGQTIKAEGNPLIRGSGLGGTFY